MEEIVEEIISFCNIMMTMDMIILSIVAVSFVITFIAYVIQYPVETFTFIILVAVVGYILYSTIFKDLYI